jgi:serine/threonine-protein kinase RsbW
VATVELAFSALPAHVRTARLVAATVARRAGVEESDLDEVRLAVGEACSRAVDLHRQHCPQEPVRVRLADDAGAFRIEVTDCAPVGSGPTGDALAALAGSADLDGADPLPGGVGIAVISGLVDDVTVESRATGTAISMGWPLGTSVRA